MKYMYWLFFAVVFGGMGFIGYLTHNDPDYQIQPVKVVEVVHEQNIGFSDTYTVVEFQDGSRRWRWKTWGKVGDTILGRKSQCSSTTAPISGLTMVNSQSILNIFASSLLLSSCSSR